MQNSVTIYTAITLNPNLTVRLIWLASAFTEFIDGAYWVDKKQNMQPILTYIQLFNASDNKKESICFLSFAPIVRFDWQK